ncbi:MAG: non-ribosomal peptide synthetase, partial [Gemmatimonadaceae bacterium]
VITETTVHVTYKSIDTPEIENGSSNIGGPIPTLSLYVLDEQLQPVPIGVTGELCVGGAGVARGYLNRPTLTAERFVPSPFRPGERLYRSGDLGRIRSRGEVEYLGRRDEQVKIRGFRIELGEIGSVLGAHPDVTACFTMVRSTNIGDPRIVAYYVPREAPLSVETLRAWAAQRLPEFMIPSAFVPLSALPVTGNGKVNRAQLPEPELAGSSAQLIEPRNDVEEVVAGLWREILQIDNVGVESSFFEVGGHSLLATRITGRVSKIFRVTFPLRQFFESPTVAGIARTLTQLEAKPGQADLIARLYKKAQQMTPEQRESLRQSAAATRQAQEL